MLILQAFHYCTYTAFEMLSYLDLQSNLLTKLQ